MASFARDVSVATASQTDFNLSFNYLVASHVNVFVNGVLKVEGAASDYTFFDATTIRFNAGLTGGETVVRQRKTSQTTRLTNYTAGVLGESALDNDSFQAFYMAQEAIDTAALALGKDSAELWDALSTRIINVGAPTASTDAATKGYVDSAALGTLPSPLGTASGGTGGATPAAARTSLGVAIGTDVQAFDADLLALAGLTSAANKVARFTGSGTADLLDFLDQDTLSSDSATAIASQQSIKAYVDAAIAAAAGVTTGTPLTQSPYALSATVTQAHGLGARPTFIVVEAVCTSASQGWEAGDRVVLSEYGPIAGGATAWTINWDATNVVMTTSATAGTILDEATRGNVTLTIANWNIIITPYLVS